MTAVGFIGLGAMGGSLARRLADRGYDVLGYDISDGAREAFGRDGGHPVAGAAEAVGGARIVFTSLPTPELVESFWAEHSAELVAGSTVVETSTIDPMTARRTAQHVLGSAAGNYVACTIGKTPDMALAGRAPLYVGAERQPSPEVRSVLESLSTTILDMGSVEGSTTFKLISNLIGMSNLAALAEGYALAAAQGVSGDVFREALMTTGGWSSQAELRLDSMVRSDYAPRFAVDLAAKDLRLTVDAAARLGVPVMTGAAALQLFQLARRAGDGGLDAAAVHKVLDTRQT